jgi:hypothetical protein
MNTRLTFGILASCIAAFPTSALPQTGAAMSSSYLRQKYGQPLARETFTARPGIEMVVDYAANGHVCRIHFPPVGPGRDPGVKTNQAIDDILAELVPVTMRGKELRKGVQSAGAISLSTVEYENNITVAELQQAGTRTGVSVIFKKEECAKPTN